jgi:hypothetical protein
MYVYNHSCVSKLVKTQTLLDPVVLSKVKLKLKSRKVSLVSYIRQLLEKNLNLQTENIEKISKTFIQTRVFYK